MISRLLIIIYLSMLSWTSLAGVFSVTESKRELAKEIALRSGDFDLTEAVNTTNLILSSEDLQQMSASLAPLLEKANQSLAQQKGYESVHQLFQLRLAKASMLQSLRSGIAPLFAYEPKGSDKYWSQIEAFDHTGNSIFLDARKTPRVPVFVVELDSSKDLALGLEQMQTIFSRGLRSNDPVDQFPQPAANLETTLIDRISINDVQESWISGNAEIYALVTGIEADQKDAKITVVDMPYLNDDNKNYYPNQIIIFWNNYRYQAADIVFMEQDDNTNYQEIARRLLSAAEAYLNSVGKVDFATIAKLTNQIIETLPDSWFTNDDDFVDVYYTLRKGRNYSRRYGAGFNVNMDLSPEIIPEN